MNVVMMPARERGSLVLVWFFLASVHVLLIAAASGVDRHFVTCYGDDFQWDTIHDGPASNCVTFCTLYPRCHLREAKKR